jgi:hypothetical protein
MAAPISMCLAANSIKLISISLIEDVAHSSTEIVVKKRFEVLFERGGTYREFEVSV